LPENFKYCFGTWELLRVPFPPAGITEKTLTATPGMNE